MTFTVDISPIVDPYPELASLLRVRPEVIAGLETATLRRKRYIIRTSIFQIFKREFKGDEPDWDESRYVAVKMMQLGAAEVLKLLKTPSKWEFGRQVGHFRKEYGENKRWKEECGEEWEFIESDEGNVSDDWVIVESPKRQKKKIEYKEKVEMK